MRPLSTRLVLAASLSALLLAAPATSADRITIHTESAPVASDACLVTDAWFGFGSPLIETSLGAGGWLVRDQPGFIQGHVIEKSVEDGYYWYHFSVVLFFHCPFP